MTLRVHRRAATAALLVALGLLSLLGILATGSSASSAQSNDASSIADLFVTGYDAGRGLGGYDSTSGTRLSDVDVGSAGLSASHGLVFGSDGVLYVSDPSSNVIERFDGSDGAHLGTLVTTEIAATAGLDGPAGLTFSPSGHLLVAGARSGNIVGFDTETGEFIDVAVAADHDLRRPVAVATGPDGDLYVADAHDDDIEVFSGDTGEHLATITLGAGASPSDLLFAPTGELLVALEGTSDVVAISDDGSVRSVTNAVVSPSGLALATDGSLWVSDYWNDSIQRVDLRTGETFETANFGDTVSGPRHLAFVPPKPTSPVDIIDPLESETPAEPLTADEWTEAVDGDEAVDDLIFIPNDGVADPALDFVAESEDYVAVVADTGLLIDVDGSETLIEMSLADADATPPTASSGERAVAFDDVYPGIDAVYTPDGAELEYSFIVEPGADPSEITLDFEGVRSAKIEESGDLFLDSADGPDLLSTAPFTYQYINGQQVTVSSAYEIRSDGSVGFVVGAYDTTRSLVIDPTLTPATNLVMVTFDGTLGDPRDAEREAFFTSLGYSVAVIAATDTQTAFNNAATANDVMFMTATASGATGVGVKARGLDIGVLTESVSAFSDLMYAPTFDFTSLSSVSMNTVLDNSHYITSPLPLGATTFFSPGQLDLAWDSSSSSLASGAQVLVERSADQETLIAIDTGAGLFSANSALNRRVYVPSFDSPTSSWAADLQTVMERAVAWGTGEELGAGCTDSDGDGLCDLEEDANTDADNDPTTNPGPDTDGDALPNYLDADDDGDGIPTATENADPNGDGDPRDALDTDHDGQPDYLDLPTGASDATVIAEQKISDTQGGFTATLAFNAKFATSLASIGDIDGDGVNDLAVGAIGDNTGGAAAGAVYILFLNADGTVRADQKITESQGGFTTALDSSDSFGASIAGIGDLDGDGINDIAVGAPRDDGPGASDRGAIYVLLLNADGTVKAEQKISDSEGGFTTTLDGSDKFGASLTALGDLDGDGINDIAVGAPEDDDGTTNAGSVYVLFMNADGTAKSEQKISDTQGGFTTTLDGSDYFGSSITGIGDLDGDGINDIAVGAREDDDGAFDGGAVYILLLNANGTVKAEQKVTEAVGGFTAVLDTRDYFGASLTGIGDLDGDGTSDLVVGAPEDDDGSIFNVNRGAVYILFLNPDGTVDSHQKISDTEGNLTTALGDSDFFGSSVAGIGDRNGDGAIDLAVGAPDDDDGGLGHGGLYILDLSPARCTLDSDGDGLWDCEEDANTDADGDPTTNPGPDTDGDTTPNYLDADDDGDGTPTASENADPNGDGDPRDALDSDLDGQPDYLDLPVIGATFPIVMEQKISSTVGGLVGPLANGDQIGEGVAGIGDLDGDGTNDLIIGASGDDDGGTNTGAVYITFLNTDGTVRNEQKISATAGGLAYPIQPGDYFGHGVASVGDLDGDGRSEVAVGSWEASSGGSNRGAVDILFLNADGTVRNEQRISAIEGGLSATVDDSDRWGAVVAAPGDIDGDGFPDLLIGSPFDDDGQVDAGAAAILFLNADGTVRDEQKISALEGGLPITLEASDQFGFGVTGLDDVNGDGTPDVAVGIENGGINDDGSFVVLLLNPDGTVLAGQEVGEGIGGFVGTLDPNATFGREIQGVGDLDGDGTVDVIATAIRDEGRGNDRGAIHLLSLNDDGTVLAQQELSDGVGGLVGPLDDGDQFGSRVAVLGDLDGDGSISLAIGARFDDDGGSDRGAVYVVELCGRIDSDGDGLWDCEEDANSDRDGDPSTSPGPDTDGDTLPNYLDADDDGDGIPTATENADPNGDGDPRDALDSDLDGQPDYLDVEAGPSTTPIADEQKISDLVGGLTTTLDDADWFGSSIASVGDLDGDGVVDVAVGAYYDDDGAGSHQGAVYVLFLNADGTVKAEQKISDTVGGLTATLDDSDFFGSSVAGVGDLDGDGIGDLAVGATSDDDGGAFRGAVYLLFLNADGTVKAEQKISDTEGGLTTTLDNSDYFGTSVAGVGDLDGDGIPDLAVGAEGDDDGGGNRGAVYVLFLNTDGTVKAEQKISDTAGGLTTTLDDFDNFGSSVAGVGDLDGDGIGDLAVGATGDGGGGFYRGAVYLLFLNADGTVKAEQKISDTAGGLTTTLDDSDNFGSSVAGVGDLDGDGIPDLAVGAYRDDDGGTGRGAVYVLFLNTDGTVKAEQKVSDTTGGLTTTLDDSDAFGWSVTGLGDLDSDDTLNLAVGAPRDADGGGARGAVYVLDLSPPGCPADDADGDGLWDCEEDANTDADDDPATNAGPDTDGDTLPNYLDADDDGDGTPTASENADPNSDGDPRDALDIDHDGQPDYLDLPTDPSGGTVADEQKISSTVGGLVGPLDEQDDFGAQLSAIGDLDGDGTVDLAIGAEFDDDGGNGRGAVYVLFMNPDGTVKAEQKISDVEGGLASSLTDGDAFGSSVSGLGDLDGDGVEDIAVGARADDDGSGNAGAVYVLFMNPDGTVKAEQKISDTTGGLTTTLGSTDFFGASVSRIGDLDADGIPDLAVGARLDDDGGSNRGAIYILFLNPDGTVKAEQKISDTTGGLTTTLGDNDTFGSSVSGIGDLDGDGILDLAVGARGDNGGSTDEGAAYVLFLNANGTVKAEQKIANTVGGFTGSLANGDYFGESVSGVGDLDADGIADLVVGAPGTDGGSTDEGAVHVLFMNANGTVKAEQRIAEGVGGLGTTLDTFDTFGYSVAGLGDLDGDGIVNLAVGAPDDDDGGAGRGAVYILDLAPPPAPPPVVLDNIQKGTTTLADGSSSVTETITAVDPSRSFLTFTFRGDNAEPSNLQVRGELTDPTTVTFRRSGSATNVVIEWSVVEFASGVTVQRGTANLSSATTDVPISSIDPSQSFPLLGMSVTGSVFGDNDFVRAELTTSTNLRLTTRGATNNNNVDWQVVTYNDSTVQTGTVNFGIGDASATATIASVDPSKAWLLYSAESDNGTANDIGQKLVRGLITDPTTLSFDRANTGQAMVLQWHVVEFTDATDVQHGSTAFSAGATTRNVTINPVSSARSIATGGYLEYAGRSPYSGDDNPGVSSFTTELTSATNLRIRRASTVDSADLGWSVVHWQCDDADTDGLCNSEEDANTDADNDPTTNPGPDTDGDTTPNYLDPDDDGDGTLTSAAAEAADPNGDGDPRDALDTDHDGQPDYLDAPTALTDASIADEAKVSDAFGGFATSLADTDLFGSSVASVGDLDGDGIEDLAVGAPYDDDGGSNRGAVYITFMNADGTVRAEQKISDSEGAFTAALTNADLFGSAVASVGDLDGDGINDIAVGAPQNEADNSGGVHILFLNSDGTVRAEQLISNTDGTLATVLGNADYFGSAVAGLGDLDGDGINDIAVGAAGDDDGGTGRGAVYVVFLNANGTVKGEQKISDTAGTFTAILDDNDSFGSALAQIGDIDGDGITDLAVGAPKDDDSQPATGANQGAVHVLLLDNDGTVQSSTKISDTNGDLTTLLDSGDEFGTSLSGVGDLDLDGVPDLVVGAPYDDDGAGDRGAAYVLFMTASGGVKAEGKISDTDGNLTASLDNADWFGFAIAGLGDSDDDGTIGIAVGAPNDDDDNTSNGGNNRGAFYVLDLSPLALDITVNSTRDLGDVTPGDGVCDTGDTNSATVTECTLRAAIEEANAYGSGSISFDMPITESGHSAGVWTISPASAFEDLVVPVTIDGSSHPDWVATPVVQIDGTAAGAGVDGLRLLAGSDRSEIRGLSIGNFDSDGIEIASDDVLIAGNHLGLDAAGVAATRMTTGAGVNVTGASRTMVGGSVASDRNVISGGEYGIRIGEASADTSIAGNYIGTDGTGSSSFGAIYQYSVYVLGGSSNTSIGGPAAAEGNIISSRGIYIRDEATDTTLIENNSIGIGADGTSSLTVSARAILITLGSDDVDIIDNVIGNSYNAIQITGPTTNASIQGNLIGTDAGLTAFHGTSAEAIVVEDGATAIQIGGLAPAEANQIHSVPEPLPAIIITGSATDDVHVLGNTIMHAHGTIDLGDDGPTPNDPLDVDGGANDLLNYPTVAVTNTTGSGPFTVDLDVTLDAAAGNYRIEIYANSAPGFGGVGRAEQLVHTFTVAHTGSGDETFTTSYTDTSFTALSATATEEFGGGAYGSTSEMSPIAPNIGQTAVVNSTADSGDSDLNDATCDTGGPSVGGNPECTLRAAIELANRTSGVTIEFAIPETDSGYDSAGFWTISQASDLERLYGPATTIDGSTQPTFDGSRPVIYIEDNSSGIDLITTRADDITLRSLALGRPGDDAVQIEADRVTIDSLWIGIDPSGADAGRPRSGNEGLIVYNDTTDLVVSDSRISGFDSGVISNSGTIDATVSGTEIFGNRNGGIVFPNLGRVTATGNAIHDNIGLGIDLGTTDGVPLANDPGDADAGGNALLNYPVLTTATIGSGTLDVTYDLDVPAGTYRIEFFNNTLPDPSGNGEGETFVASATFAHAGGSASYLTTIPGVDGDVITATATPDLGGGTFGGTSEFSNALAIGVVFVNSTGDASDSSAGDGACDTGALNSDGATECTLRAAIEEANANASIDHIRFTIPETDPNFVAGTPDFWTITPATSLPFVSDAIEIDATTQPGWAGTPIVELDGSTVVTAGADGINVAADMTLRGFSITGWIDDGAYSDQDNIVVAGNWFGISPDGGALPNGSSDVVIYGTSDAATVGGPDPEDANIFAAGGVEDGLLLAGNATNSVVENNRFGVAADGVTGLGTATAELLTISESASDLLVVGNQFGDAPNAALTLWADPTNVTIVGNIFGTDESGTAVLPIGLAVYSSTTGNARFGGTSPSEYNTVRNTLYQAIFLASGHTGSFSYLGNSTTGSGAYGIDFNGDGLTPNDAGDGDSGPNDLLNFPEISTATQSAGTVRVAFGLDVPAGTYRIEAFTNPSGAHGTGYGEGESFQAASTVNHTGSGVETFEITFTGNVGDLVSLTATEDLGGGTYGSTSEFSRTVSATDPALSLIDDASVRRSDLLEAGGLSVALNNDPTDVADRGPGDAVHFDGVNDRLVAPAVDITDSAVSLRASINPDALTGDPRVLSKRTASGSSIYELFIDSATSEAVVALRVGGVTVTASGGTISTATWNQLDAVWDGSELTLYVDGIEVDRAVAVGALATDVTTKAIIGNDDANGSPFDGLIGDVRISHDVASAASIAASAQNSTAPGFVTVGAEQTSTPGAWAVSGTQTRSGSFALSAPETSGSGSAAWAVATGIDEPGLVFESWWWFSSDSGIDLSSGTRAGAAPTDQYEAALTSPSGWELRQRAGGSGSFDAPAAGSPSAGAWMNVEVRTDQLGDTRLFVDGVEVTTTTPQGSALLSGSMALRAGLLPTGENWFIDDARGRKLVTPEPVATVSSLDRN